MTYLCPGCYFNPVDEPDEYCFTCQEDLVSEAFHRAFKQSEQHGEPLRCMPILRHDALMEIVTAARHVTNAGNALIRGMATNDLKRALAAYDALGEDTPT